LVRLDGVGGPRALEAILSVMPLDDFVETPAMRIEVVGDPDHVPEVCREYQDIINRVEGERWTIAPLERFAFYDRTRRCFAVVPTGETRLYGCIILIKGIIRPPT
jgi:L-fucose mutarotase